ncbi:MAG: hypothetical protein DHS20C02_09180 [Micavibrio sp.]|nr:MAG: hypothetical protein DHS20C02_09180 [Micavibrio sp.]
MKSLSKPGIFSAAAFYMFVSLVPSAQAAFNPASSAPNIDNKKLRTSAVTVPMPPLCNKSLLARELSLASQVTGLKILMKGIIEKDPNFKENPVFFQTLSSLTANTLFSKKHADPIISAIAHRVGCKDKSAKPRLVAALLKSDIFKNYPASSASYLFRQEQLYLDDEQKLEAEAEMLDIFSRYEKSLQESLAVLMGEIAGGNSDLSLMAFSDFNKQYRQFLEEWYGSLNDVMQRRALPASAPAMP